MKVRLLIPFAIILAIIGIVAVLATTPVSADGGPHRPRTSMANITSCGECHRAHTAESTTLIAQASIYALCTSCHGPSYHTPENVVDGMYIGGSTVITAPLKGGGFVNVTMNNTYTATLVTSSPSLSQHEVLGMPGYISDTVWGFGAISNTPNPGLANFQLQCTTCHDPHGGSGVGVSSTGVRNGTYRILRSDLSGKLGASVPTAYVPDNTTKKYYIDDTTTDRYYGQKYPTGNEVTPAAGHENDMPTLISDWCATCHTRIHAPGGSDPENTSSGDALFDFRHRTDGNNVAFNWNPAGLPVNNPGAAPSCFTCHVSHGSNSSLSNGRGGFLNVPIPGGDETTGPFLDSTLLRLNGRGVCEACHNK